MENKNNYYNSYQNNYSNCNNNTSNNANGYERFPNGKMNYSMTSPRVNPSNPTVIPSSFTSPVLSPASSFSSLYSMSSSSIPPYASAHLNTQFNKPLSDNENTNEILDNDNEDIVKEDLGETVNEDDQDNNKELDELTHVPLNENESVTQSPTNENDALTHISTNDNDELPNHVPTIVKYQNASNDSTKATSNPNLNTNGNSDNHLLRNNYRIPITNNLIISYSMPMLSPLNNNNINNINKSNNNNNSNNTGDGLTTANESFSSNSHYLNNSFSSVSTSITENMFEIDEDFRKQRFLSSSPLLSGHQADTEMNDSGKDNSFSSTSKDFLSYLMNRPISPETKSTTTEFDSSRRQSNSDYGIMKEKLEEQVAKAKERARRRRRQSTASSNFSDNDKLNIITGTSLTSPTISILSPSPVKPSNKINKVNSTTKPIPTGFDSIKYPTILNLNPKVFGENEETDLLNSESTTVSDDSNTSGTSTVTESTSKKGRGRNKQRSDSILSRDSDISRAASVTSVTSVTSNASTSSTPHSIRKKERKSAVVTGESESESVSRSRSRKNEKKVETESSEATTEASVTPKRTRKSQAKKARESIRELSKTAFEKPRTVNDILSIFKNVGTSKKEESVKKEPMSYAKMLSKNIQQPRHASVEKEHKLLKVPPKEERNL
ncbi:hypothetical protein PIROE2DRAFT_60127 [Piromyces sp. E2]|nr:hypothetical protein PIROE2DRAFT_60127 [Piromyces sp. E2]|eukprot:OUM65266.1 hypothetical protein PIROE2DRAFT_60127 [Piromyces sp. E2]